MKRAVAMRQLVLVGSLLMIPYSFFAGWTFTHLNRTDKIIASEAQVAIVVSILGNIG